MDTASCKVKLSIRPVGRPAETRNLMLSARPYVPRQASQSLRTAAQHHPEDTMGQDRDSRNRLHAALKTLLGAAAIASASSMISPPAVAYTAIGSQSNRDWKPRRHHRRLEDRQRTVDLGARSKAGPA